VALTILASSMGCSSLRYKKSEDLWAESDQRFRNGAYSDAIPYYDELLRRDDQDGRARRLRAISRDRTGETQGALEDYEKAASRGDSSSLLFRANLNIKSGYYEAAERDLAALRDAPLDSHEKVAQLTLVGTLRVRQGNWRLAAQSLERACDLSRGAADPFTMAHARDAHYNAAQAYYQMGEFDKAMEHVDQYARLSDASGNALDGEDYYQLTLIHYLAGDFEGARGFRAKADPDKCAQAAKTLNDPAFWGGK
jgi:tetratricopeptide (TPR) repeat protein